MLLRTLVTLVAHFSNKGLYALSIFLSVCFGAEQVIDFNPIPTNRFSLTMLRKNCLLLDAVLSNRKKWLKIFDLAFE